MDHAHGHPRSRPSPAATRTLPTRVRPDRDQHADPEYASPSARQQRLLRTGTAKFPAKKLSISSLSSRFSQLVKANDSPPRAYSPAPRNRENAVYRTHRDRPSASLSASSLGILEEVTNAISGRGKTHQKRKPIPLFEDTPERGLLEASPHASSSPYGNASSLVSSPQRFNHIQDSLGGMGLREISGNARKISAVESPPFVASVRSARRRKSTAKSHFNSEEYIEHIERELELIKDAVYSPNSNRPWKEKLKIAKAENERLRGEIVNVRSAFEVEVQKAVEHMTSNEVDLRRKVRSLEHELEQKESTIHGLEHQHDEKRLDQGPVDTLKATIERLESEKSNLEQDNESISRRNEVLTQLLALSPTKAHQFDLSSPVRPRNTPRPKSMMIPRMPPSPSTDSMSRSQSVLASPVTSSQGYFSPRQPSMSTPPHARMQDLAAGHAQLPSLRRSLTGSTSRRSTINSEASASASSVDLQRSTSDTSEQPVKQQNPRRRTRRFLQGSTQLKPLLLSTLTGENGALHSASTTSQDHTNTFLPGQDERRVFSEESIDPTTTFLSKSPAQYEPELDSYPFRHDSDLITSRQLAYHSLEGVLDCQPLTDSNEYLSKSLDWQPEPDPLPVGSIDVSIEEAWSNSQHSSLDQWIYDSGPIVEEDFDMTILPTHCEPVTDCGAAEDIILDTDCSPFPAPRQLSVEIPEPLFSPLHRQNASSYFATPITRRRNAQHQPPRPIPETNSNSTESSRKRRKLSSSSEDELQSAMVSIKRPMLDVFSPMDDSIRATITLLDVTSATDENIIATTTAITPSHSRRSSSSSLLLRSPGSTKSPLEILQQRNIDARPLAAVTIKTIYGTLSRYTTYIREIKRDPTALARRVIANAWHANWKLLGKLSWWVLGLFLGPRSKGQDNNAWDWGDYDAESIANRQCRRSWQGVDEQHFRLLRASESPERRVRFDEQHSSYRTRGSRSPARPALKKKASWGESLLLWGKFSVAIMLAVGGAVVKGPGEMLRDADERSVAHSQPPRTYNRSRHERPDSSPNRKHYDDEASNTRSRPIDLPGSTDNRKRLKNRSPSPPPSARMLLRSGEPSSSPPQPSPSPAFHFGNNEVFEFSSHAKIMTGVGSEMIR